MAARCLCSCYSESFTWQRRGKNRRFKCIVYKTHKNIMKYQLYTVCVEKLSMIIGCNIWMICLELKWFFYDPNIKSFFKSYLKFVYKCVFFTCLCDLASSWRRPLVHCCTNPQPVNPRSISPSQYSVPLHNNKTDKKEIK